MNSSQFTYKMYAIYKKGNLSGAAINTFIAISSLLNDIISYCNYNEIETPSTNNDKMKAKSTKPQSTSHKQRRITEPPLIKSYVIIVLITIITRSSVQNLRKSLAVKFVTELLIKRQCRTKQDRPVNVIKISYEAPESIESF